jgi:hypothetical protein
MVSVCEDRLIGFIQMLDLLCTLTFVVYPNISCVP